MVKNYQNLKKYIKKNGISYTLKRILSEIHWNICLVFRPKSCKSYYGPYFSANYDDNTFKYYIVGKYGNFLANRIKNDSSIDTFFDVGSNQGLYSCLAGENVKISNIISFEPNQEIYELHKKNISYKNLDEKVFCFNYAIGSIEGEMELQVPKNHSGAGKVSNKDSINNEDYSIMKIKMISSDWLNNEFKDKNFTSIGLKIDVEGYEPVVIDTLRNSDLWDKVKWIFFEASSERFDVEKVLNTLTQDGFIEENRITSSDESAQFDIFMTRKL